MTYEENWNFARIDFHFGHKIEVVRYTHPITKRVANVSIECEDCNEVIFDADARWMEEAIEAAGRSGL